MYEDLVRANYNALRDEIGPQLGEVTSLVLVEFHTSCDAARRNFNLPVACTGELPLEDMLEDSNKFASNLEERVRRDVVYGGEPPPPPPPPRGGWKCTRMCS